MIRKSVKNMTYPNNYNGIFTYCIRFYYINKTLIKNEKNNHATKHIIHILIDNSLFNW